MRAFFSPWMVIPATCKCQEHFMPTREQSPDISVISRNQISSELLVSATLVCHEHAGDTHYMSIHRHGEFLNI
jgi:hypothetical protein